MSETKIAMASNPRVEIAFQEMEGMAQRFLRRALIFGGRRRLQREEENGDSVDLDILCLDVQGVSGRERFELSELLTAHIASHRDPMVRKRAAVSIT